VSARRTKAGRFNRDVVEPNFALKDQCLSSEDYASIITSIFEIYRSLHRSDRTLARIYCARASLDAKP
jgi:hypothetical protein